MWTSIDIQWESQRYEVATPKQLWCSCNHSKYSVIPTDDTEDQEDDEDHEDDEDGDYYFYADSYDERDY
jgi:hypothetical protein